MPTSCTVARDEWARRAQAVLPGGVLSRYVLSRPVVTRRGRGARLYDTEGNEYIDYSMGGGSILLGHASAVVNDAIRSQIDDGIQFFSIVNTRAIELAERLVQVIPCAEQARFTVSGSEAIAGATRIARVTTGRRLVLKFEGAYHGNHDPQLLSVGGASGEPSREPVPDSEGIAPGATKDVVLAPFNDLDATREIVRRHAKDLAAVFVEPVQRYLPPAPGFLEGLRALATEVGSLLVYDEIVTGFRIDYRGAQGKYGTVPDLAVYGKVLGGGIPIGAICGVRDVMQNADPTRDKKRHAVQTGTLNGNPLGCAVALAMMNHLSDGQIYSRLDALSARLREGLQRIFAEEGLDAHVHGLGSLWHVLFQRERAATFAGTLRADRTRLLAFQQGLLDNGIYVVPGVRSFVSAAHTSDDIDRTLEVARQVVKDRASHATSRRSFEHDR